MPKKKKPLTSPVRLEYPAWDYWDEFDPNAAGRNHLPMIVFDLDGTLLDSQELVQEDHRQVAERMGLPPISPEVLESLKGADSEEIMSILGLPSSRIPDYEHHAWEVNKRWIHGQAKLFPGIQEMLALLSDHAALCLLSNGPPRYAEESAHVTGIAQYFDYIQGFVPGMTKARRLSIWKNRHAPTRMMMVGDRPTDIESAHTVGALGVGVLYGAGTLEEMRDADMIARDVSELRRICLAFCEI